MLQRRSRHVGAGCPYCRLVASATLRNRKLLCAGYLPSGKISPNMDDLEQDIQAEKREAVAAGWRRAKLCVFAAFVLTPGWKHSSLSWLTYGERRQRARGGIRKRPAGGAKRLENAKKILNRGNEPKILLNTKDLALLGAQNEPKTNPILSVKMSRSKRKSGF